MSSECPLCHNGPVTEGGCGNPKCPGRNFDDNDAEIQKPPPLNPDNPEKEDQPKPKEKPKYPPSERKGINFDRGFF